MKFTHNLDMIDGWNKTVQIPSDYKEVKHLGECSIDGDMFAAYNNQAEIHIFKGTMEDNHVWTNPTDDEVEENLIKLAKNKGFKNVHELKLKSIFGDVFQKGDFIFEGNEFTYDKNENTLCIDGVTIFKDGEWAEILEDKLSLEQRIKNLEDKIF